jgi:hypothetical protein
MTSQSLFSNANGWVTFIAQDRDFKDGTVLTVAISDPKKEYNDTTFTLAELTLTLAGYAHE